MIFRTFRVLFFLICCYDVCFSDKRVRYDLLEITVEGISKALKYYDKNYNNMNLDGIFGLRVIQGQIMQIKQQLVKSNSDLLDHPLIRRLEKFSHQAQVLSQSSIKYLERDSPKYLREVYWVVGNPWKFASSNFHNIYARDRIIFDRAVVDVDDDEVEIKSDGCISNMTNEKMRCELSQTCLNFITNKKSAGYELTHQLLNIMVIHMVNCTNSANAQLERHLGGSTLSDLEWEFCAKSFFEVSTIITKNNGLIPRYYKDLFLEELMVCPMLGYYQFLHEEWLRLMLSWQEDNGCWMELKDFNYFDLKSELGNVHMPKRRLLYEKVLPDGCSSHVTAVAIAALTQFLRYLILCEISENCGISLPKDNYLLFPHLLPYEPSAGFHWGTTATIIIIFIIAVLFVTGRLFKRRILRTMIKLRHINV